MTHRLYRLLLATGFAFALSLALAVLDGINWLVLPQPFRLAIPVTLIVSVFVGVVVLSAAIGMPKRPGTEDDVESEPEREDATSEDRP